MKILLLTYVLFVGGNVNADENKDSAKEFVATIIQSLADGGK